MPSSIDDTLKYSTPICETNILKIIKPGDFVQLKERVQVVVVHGRLRTNYTIDIDSAKVGVVTGVPDLIEGTVKVEFDILVNDKEKKHELKVHASNLNVNAVSGNKSKEEGAWS